MSNTPPDRGDHPNRKYELSLEDELRRRIPQEGFRGTSEALERLYPSKPARTPDPTTQPGNQDCCSGGEGGSGSEIAEALKNSGWTRPQ